MVSVYSHSCFLAEQQFSLYGRYLRLTSGPFLAGKFSFWWVFLLVKVCSDLLLLGAVVLWSTSVYP